MLAPTKHSHPDRTVVHLSLLLLAQLKKYRVQGYDALRHFARKQVVGSDFLFLPALNFLYLMGLIEYRPKTDSLEYVGLDANKTLTPNNGKQHQ